MSIRSLARAWDHFGRRDAQWAALTDRRLSPEEFFKSGEDELQLVLDHAQALGLAVNRDRALDFGCGIGRLTQAMAARFRRCDGVDIARSMIETARRYNRHPDTCHYHVNASGDLSLFADGAFSFVFTVLVLQHMKPEQAKTYVREFMRVLGSGGLLVFQLPSHRGPDEPPPGAPRTLSNQPLPPAAFRARVSSPASDLAIDARALLTVPVVVRNGSAVTWPSLGRADAKYQIQVASRWLRPNGSALGVEEARCPLPYDLAPGAEVTVSLGVHAPAVNGTYALELDVIQEDVSWFSEMESSSARIHVTVRRGLPADAHADDHAAEARPAFRFRHPYLYRIFKAVGIRALYWKSRYAIETLKREREVWRRRYLTEMKMHCVPQDEVADLVREGGCVLVEAEHHVMDGGFQSRMYWVVRPAPDHRNSNFGEGAGGKNTGPV
jgi:SAM-dependent methyltransferase